MNVLAERIQAVLDSGVVYALRSEMNVKQVSLGVNDPKSALELLKKHKVETKPGETRLGFKGDCD